MALKLANRLVASSSKNKLVGKRYFSNYNGYSL